MNFEYIREFNKGVERPKGVPSDWVVNPINNLAIDFITLDNENNMRYFDVKTNAKRSDGTKICRTNNKVPGLRIEIVYVDLDTNEVREHSFDKGEWHKKYKIDRKTNMFLNTEIIVSEWKIRPEKFILEG